MNRRLEQFLAAENISQAQFADTIEVARASVSHIIAGRNKPGFDFISSMLLHYPSLNAEWLLTGRGRMYKDAVKNEVQPAEESQDEQPDLFSYQDNNAPEEEIPETPHEEHIPVQTAGSAEIPVSHEGRKISRIIVFFDDNTYQEIH